MQKMGVEEGEVIEHPWVTGAIGNAQKRVEAHNFDIRKHLLEYDDVMNKQRAEIYRQRNDALDAVDLSERVLEDVRETVQSRVTKYLADGTHRSEWNLRGLADELAYVLMMPVSPDDLSGDRVEEVQEQAGELAERAYRGREAEFGPEMMRELERHLYLYTIDEHWRDHLYELDHLKGGIGLRAYGQRDPLIEYKKEAFNLFETLLDETREDFVSRLFRVQLAPQAEQVIASEPKAPKRMVAQHAEAEAFGGGVAVAEAEGGAPASAAPAAPAPAMASPAAPMHAGPRVGRNDPCPCGSGKKYKKCHGASEGSA